MSNKDPPLVTEDAVSDVFLRQHVRWNTDDASPARAPRILSSDEDAHAFVWCVWDVVNRYGWADQDQSIPAWLDAVMRERKQEIENLRIEVDRLRAALVGVDKIVAYGKLPLMQDLNDCIDEIGDITTNALTGVPS